MLAQALLINAGAVTPEQSLGNLADAAAQDVANVRTLSVAGARYIIVPNLPDISATPQGLAAGAAGRTFFAAATATYNSVLASGLQQLGGSNIVLANINRLFNEVIADPASFGLDNVTEPACTTSSSLTCSADTLVAPNAQNTHFFADDVHPTLPGHTIIADYVASILAAPGQIGLLAENPIYTARGIYRSLDARMTRTVRRATGFQFYGNIDYAPYELDSARAHSGVDGQARSGYIGMEYGFGGGLSVGTLLNYSHGDYDFSHSGGGFDTDMRTGTIYATVSSGGAYAQVSGTLGSIDYDSIDRRFRLGSASRANTGSSNGRYYGARLATGYDFDFGGFTVGPIAQLTYQKATVDGYSERNANSTAMAFGSQSRHLFYGTVGGQMTLDTELAGRPLHSTLSVKYNYDFPDQDRSVRAGLIGAPATFKMPDYKPGRSWTDIAIGAAVDVSASFATNLAIGSQLGQGDVTNYYFNVGASYKF